MSRDPYATVAATAREVMRQANGHTLTGRTYRALLAVLEYTLTWSKLGDTVSLSDLGEAANIPDRRNLRRELRVLSELGLIVYVPGASPAGGARKASWVGLPTIRPGATADPRSEPGQGVSPDPLSGQTTGGQLWHGPGVNPGTDRGSAVARTGGQPRPPFREVPEESSEKTPEPRAREDAETVSRTNDRSGEVDELLRLLTRTLPDYARAIDTDPGGKLADVGRRHLGRFTPADLAELAGAVHVNGDVRDVTRYLAASIDRKAGEAADGRPTRRERALRSARSRGVALAAVYSRDDAEPLILDEYPDQELAAAALAAFDNGGGS